MLKQVNPPVCDWWALSEMSAPKKRKFLCQRAIDIIRLNMKKELIGHTQNVLHTQIGAFLNGVSLTRTSKLFFPLWKSIKFSGYGQEICEMKPSFEQYAEVLCEQYLAFYKDVKRLGKKTTVHFKVNFPTWNARALPNNGTIQIIKRLQKEAFRFNARYNFFYDIILYGSYATCDFTAWSDIDIVIIVNSNVFAKKKNLLLLQEWLLEKQKYLYFCDPLQHHGFFIITSDEMQYYPEIYLPLCVFENGISFFNKTSLTFYTRNCSTEAHKELNICLSGIRETTLKLLRGESCSPYTLKAYLSSLFFACCLYVQLHKTPLYKRDAIKGIKERLNLDELNVLEYISRLRESWGYCKQNKILKWVNLFLLYSLNLFMYRAIIKNFVRKPTINTALLQEVTAITIKLEKGLL